MTEKNEPLACLACGHEDVAHKASDLARGIFQCRGCGARMAYGKLVPRVVVEPYVDAQGNAWLRRRIQDPRTKQDLFVFDIDTPLGAIEAKNILALVIS